MFPQGRAPIRRPLTKRASASFMMAVALDIPYLFITKGPLSSELPFVSLRTGSVFRLEEPCDCLALTEWWKALTLSAWRMGFDGKEVFVGEFDRGNHPSPCWFPLEVVHSAEHVKHGETKHGVPSCIPTGHLGRTMFNGGPYISPFSSKTF